MLIDDYAEIDEVSAQELLDFTASWKYTFYSANYMPQKFIDTL